MKPLEVQQMNFNKAAEYMNKYPLEFNETGYGSGKSYSLALKKLDLSLEDRHCGADILKYLLIIIFLCIIGYFIYILFFNRDKPEENPNDKPNENPNDN
jgi:hypothetical protein